MKRFFHLFILPLLLLASCSEEESPNEVVGPIKIPEVIGISIVEGSTLTVDAGTIQVSYSTPVIVGQKLITLNGQPLTAVARNTNLVIDYPELEYETHYTLSIPEGAVISKSSNSPANAFELSFYTEEEPYMPPTTPTVRLVTPDALPAAQRVYDYLWDCYGKKTLSATMAKVNWNLFEADWLYQWTGKQPAMVTFDYIHLPYSPANWVDYSDITFVKQWWEAGGLVAAGWHWLVPKYEGSNDYTYSPTETSFRPSRALEPGTWENRVMMEDLKEMADLLLKLQEAGIPVIWRPLHEAAGNVYEYYDGKAWFWWGYDYGDCYVKLWRTMFDYFCERGLKNLIWVWTTQTKDIEYYPGDKYVDMIGRDIYNVNSPEALAAQFNSVKGQFPHKIVTLSEMGNVAPIGKQWDAGAQWSYFMPWYDNNNDSSENYPHYHATMEWWRESLDSPVVVTRDELPDFRSEVQ